MRPLIVPLPEEGAPFVGEASGYKEGLSAIISLLWV